MRRIVRSVMSRKAAATKSARQAAEADAAARPERVADQANKARGVKQTNVVNAMCKHLGMAPSTLAKQSKVPDSTITRNLLNWGGPIGDGHIAKMIDTYTVLIRKTGEEPLPGVLSYLGERPDPLGETIVLRGGGAPTADRLRRTLVEINRDLHLGLNDEQLTGIAMLQADIYYPLIVDLEQKLGRPLTDHDDDSARIHLARAEQEKALRDAMRRRQS